MSTDLEPVKPATLTEALVALQANLPKLERNQKGQVGTREYKYADLSHISDTMFPLLTALGLAFVATPAIRDDGQPVLRCSLMHVSGQREDGEYELPRGVPPQQLGSAITYGRRYCLTAMIGLASEDDRDGSMDGGTQRRSRARPAASQETGELITKPQLKLLAILAKELGYDKDRNIYLAKLTGITGRKIDSSKSLMRTEAHAVIDAWQKERDAQAADLHVRHGDGSREPLNLPTENADTTTSDVISGQEFIDAFPDDTKQEKP